MLIEASRHSRDRDRTMRAGAQVGAGPRQQLKAWSMAMLALGFLAAKPAGSLGAESDPDRLFRPDRMWTYVTGGPALTGYSRAMTQYRLLLEQRGRPTGLAGVMNTADYGDTRWTWQADDGSLIRRLDDGRFSVTRGNCVSGFCLELFCFGAGWPVFECDDGVTRKMSAPDFETVVFDGITFKRSALPEVEAPEQQ
jgi:hypothetical protein